MKTNKSVGIPALEATTKSPNQDNNTEQLIRNKEFIAFTSATIIIKLIRCIDKCYPLKSKYLISTARRQVLLLYTTNPKEKNQLI